MVQVQTDVENELIVSLVFLSSQVGLVKSKSYRGVIQPMLGIIFKKTIIFQCLKPYQLNPADSRLHQWSPMQGIFFLSASIDFLLADRSAN